MLRIHNSERFLNVKLNHIDKLTNSKKKKNLSTYLVQRPYVKHLFIDHFIHWFQF